MIAGLRSRLMLLVFSALLPFLGLIICWGYVNRQHAIVNAMEESLSLAKRLSMVHEMHIENCRQILLTLSQLPEVQKRESAQCSAIFAKLINPADGRTNITASDANGNAFASAVSLDSSVNLSDRPWFGTHFDLSWISDFLKPRRLSRGTRCGIVDRSGILLASYPDMENPAGKSMQGMPVLETILREKEGVTEALSADNVPCIFGFTPLRNPSESLFVYAAIPKAIAFEKINKDLTRGVCFLILVASLALGGSRLFGTRFILNPVNELLSLTESVENGNLGARTGGEYKAGELGKLARALDRMAETLQLRERDRLLAEEKLRKSEEKYRDLVENANCVIIRTDKTGNITFFNEYAQGAFGYSEGEILGKNVIGSIVPQISSDQQGMFNAIMENPGRYFTYENESVGSDGERAWFTWTNKVIVDENGQPCGMLCVGHDIIERKKAEEALREAGDMLQSLIHASPFGINVLDREGRVMLWNPAAEKILGWKEAEVLGRRHSWVSLDNQAEFYELLESVFRGESTSLKHVSRIRKDGSAVSIRITTTPVRDAAGNVIAAMGMFADISGEIKADQNRKQLEHQLQQSQKMEAIGTLAGGIAHDFNNILAVIFGYADIAMDAAAENSAMRSYIKEIMDAAFRARDLVKQILVFSRNGEHETCPIQVDLIVKEALKMLRASLPKTIEIVRKIESESLVLSDPSQIHQIILNLCTNAAHAMQGEGTLKVSLTDIHFETGPSADTRPGDYLMLDVSDTGHGMTSETKERIFEPYFTTKGIGEGTGLGLAVVHGIVKQCGGTIRVDSEVGQGATFQILLPTINSEVRHKAEQPKRAIKGTGERILFVDDEESIARMAQEMLRSLGYRVFSISSSVVALEVFRSNPGGFDLVITDYTMPHMTGGDMAIEIRKIRPEIPIILCTGFNEKISLERAMEMGISEFQMKPISKGELSEAILKVLRGYE